MPRGQALSATDLDRAHALRAAGHTTAQTARELGVDPKTLSRRVPGYRAPHPLWATVRQVKWIRDLRARGYTAEQVAKAVGVHRNTVLRYAPGRIGKVPVAPLREAFLASPMTAGDVARELGWWNKTKPDSSRVKRTLGLTLDHNCRSPRTMVDAETVERIADAIGISPYAVLPDDESEAA